MHSKEEPFAPSVVQMCTVLQKHRKEAIWNQSQRSREANINLEEIIISGFSHLKNKEGWAKKKTRMSFIILYNLR
jgi:hypothetical protein